MPMLSVAVQEKLRVWPCVVTRSGEDGKELADRQTSVVTLKKTHTV